jgi:hypothetical protein
LLLGVWGGDEGSRGESRRWTIDGG